MSKLKCPTLVVICGWPVSGKDTIASLIQSQLGIHWVDIDKVRHLCIGLPYPHPDESEELMEKDGLEMRRAYQLLLYNADLHLSDGRSLMITATFSRKSGQDELATIMAKYPWATLKVVQCLPMNDSQEEIERRLARGFGGGYVGGVNSYNRYLKVKNRYDRIKLDHLEIDTSPPNTPEECAQEALRYILLS